MVSDAIDKHPETREQSLSTVIFSKIWVGMAGHDRQSLKPLIHDAFSKLFQISSDGDLRISSDIDLLPAALASNTDIASVIVLVVGTGSVAMNYKREGSDFRRTGRVGGWGRLLGDDGSGYAIGREGIRKTLRHCDMHNLKKGLGVEPTPFEPLPQAILEHFQKLAPNCTPENLLDCLLFPGSAGFSAENNDTARTKAMASAASVVLSMASENLEAEHIMQSGASSVAELVRMLMEGQGVDVAHCALVLGGGLMGNSVYKEAVCRILQEECGEFSQVRVVDQPVITGAEYLLNSTQNKP